MTKLPFNAQEMSVSQLLAVIEQLAAENARLRAEIEQLKRSPARSAAPFSKNQRKKNPKRPGRKAGQGPFHHRAAPPEEEYTAPLEEVPVTETACPECGGELLEAGTEIVTNTELPPLPKPEVKAYRVHIRCCAHCQRKVRGRHAEVASGQWGATAHRLGPRAQAAAAAGLHYGEGVPQRKVPGILKCLTGLSVTQGALTQAALRLGTKQGPVAQRYEQLRQEIKEQPAIHTDDTGWRIHGVPAHLMVFESKLQVVFQIRPQHRNEEVREVIGDHYAGTLCTDRGKSYDARELEEVAQQKCVSHLQRSIDDVLKCQTGRARAFGEILKSQLKEGVALYKEFHQPTPPPDYAARVQALAEEVDWHLRPRPLKDADNQRLLKEIGRHHERGNVLRFLHEPETVSPTNNAAERALRPAVIARKVSQCSKSESGAQAFAAFKSVIGTLKKSGGEVLEKLTVLIAGTRSPSLVGENTS